MLSLFIGWTLSLSLSLSLSPSQFLLPSWFILTRNFKNMIPCLLFYRIECAWACVCVCVCVCVEGGSEPCFRSATQTIHCPHYRLQNGYHNTGTDPCMPIALISRCPNARTRPPDQQVGGCLQVTWHQQIRLPSLASRSWKKSINCVQKNAFFVHTSCMYYVCISMATSTLLWPICFYGYLCAYWWIQLHTLVPLFDRPVG